MTDILFCGKDTFSYHRTKVILSGLGKLDNVHVNLLKISSRDKNHALKLKQESSQHDFVFVPAFRHKDVAWIKKHSKAPVVFDPLISEYLTKVVDYGQWYKAPTKYLLDFKAIHAADYLIADTEAMKKYYSRFYHFPETRIAVISVGFIPDDFKASIQEKQDRLFHVGFYGSFVPLQGTNVIAKTALLLRNENIVFDIIGNGATYKDFLSDIKKYNLKNRHLHGWLPYEKLPAAISNFDIALGIFGHSGKAKRVIPNKLFHYAVMNKCIITRKSDAINEIFTPGTNIVSIEANAGKLAESIMELKNNPSVKSKIAENGYRLITQNYNDKEITLKLLNFLKPLTYTI